jgi:hypothetical protein
MLCLAVWIPVQPSILDSFGKMTFCDKAIDQQLIVANIKL